jgi:hypothetical protein
VWKHVPGVKNPADCSSRGITTEELRNHPLWWNGPAWLRSVSAFDKDITVPSLSADEQELLQSEQKCVVTVLSTSTQDSSMLTRFSSLRTLLRVTARIKRLATKQKGPITPVEVNNALITCVKNIQQQYFPAELHTLQQQKLLLTSSKLLQLCPFLDKDGVIRVGGRLRHAKISSDARNPIPIPKSSHLTSLLIMSTHLENFHSSPQLTLAVLYRQGKKNPGFFNEI